MTFIDRQQAGEKLAEKLTGELESLGQTEGKEGMILAIPRGGIVIGKKLAEKLNLPLDVLVTKKIPAPGNPELAIGAVSEGNIVFFDKELCQSLCVTEVYKKQIVSQKQKELESKQSFFRKGKPSLELKGKTVILTDDGAATGATMLAAIKMVRNQKPKQIIVALPVVALDTLQKLEAEADQVFYLEAPAMFFAVGQFYQNFNQVSDQEVIEILNPKIKNQNAK